MLDAFWWRLSLFDDSGPRLISLAEFQQFILRLEIHYDATGAHKGARVYEIRFVSCFLSPFNDHQQNNDVGQTRRVLKSE